MGHALDDPAETVPPKAASATLSRYRFGVDPYQRASLAFPPSFTARRYRQRMSWVGNRQLGNCSLEPGNDALAVNALTTIVRHLEHDGIIPVFIGLEIRPTPTT
jgi:hypothetical protein